MYFSVAVIGEKGHLYPLLLHLDIFESVWKHKNWIWSMRVRFHPHVQNAVHCHFSTRLVNQQKRHTFLFYTERHSVWYIVYYCKHILTGICYKECKGKRFILVPKWQSCRVHLQRLAVCVCKVHATGVGKLCSQKWGMTKAKWGRSMKSHAPLPCIKWMTTQTPER